MSIPVLEKTSRAKRIVARNVRRPTKIPADLIYEMVANTPIYYRGYHEVMQGQKTVEELMGSSFMQSLLISRIARFLMIRLPADYEILTNELGLQCAKGTTRAVDLAIYPKALLHGIPLHNKYLDVPPQIVIEIDTKADLSSFATPMDYYYLKTDELLAFGVNKVIWIFTEARKVMVAEARRDWLTRNWTQEIQILEDVALNLAQLLEE